MWKWLARNSESSWALSTELDTVKGQRHLFQPPAVVGKSLLFVLIIIAVTALISKMKWLTVSLNHTLNIPTTISWRTPKTVIYYLHNNPQTHSRGNEAIVAALSIQHRREESYALSFRYRDSDEMPFPNMALANARFNLDLPVPWPTCSSEVLERCLLAATTSGNMELLAKQTQSARYDLYRIRHLALMSVHMYYSYHGSSHLPEMISH
jgi:hypothetical protein